MRKESLIASKVYEQNSPERKHPDNHSSYILQQILKTIGLYFRMIGLIGLLDYELLVFRTEC